MLPPPDPNARDPARPRRPRSAASSSTWCPQSFFEAAAHNEVLQVVFWATLFASR